MKYEVLEDYIINNKIVKTGTILYLDKKTAQELLIKGKIKELKIIKNRSIGLKTSSKKLKSNGAWICKRLWLIFR